MLTNNQVKLIASLQAKKSRQKYGQFVVEGKKSIQELHNSRFQIDTLVFRGIQNTDLCALFPNVKTIEHVGILFNKISSRETPGEVLAVVNIPDNSLSYENLHQGISLFLDDIQDPGNLGTIIRLSAWYGISNLFMTTGTADIFNPKTIQSSMGGFSKINWEYNDKQYWIDKLSTLNIPILGASLSGKNIHTYSIPKSGILVIGNEGKGISTEINALTTEQLRIPGTGNIESLNAAMATAIFLDNWYRLHSSI